MVEVVGIFPAVKCPPDVKELVKICVCVVEAGIDELQDQKICYAFWREKNLILQVHDAEIRTGS